MEVSGNEIDFVTSMLGLYNYNLTGTWIIMDLIRKFVKKKGFLNKLKTIIIKDNSIGYYGLRAFAAQSASFTNLTTINLNSNQIGNEEFKEFATQAANFSNLKKIC